MDNTAETAVIAPTATVADIEIVAPVEDDASTVIHTKNRADLDALAKMINIDGLGKVRIVHSMTKQTVADPLTGVPTEKEVYDKTSKDALNAAAKAGKRIITTGMFLDQATEYGELRLVRQFGNKTIVNHLFAKNIVDNEAFARLKGNPDFDQAFGLTEPNSSPF
jgi:hypothetical protein